MCAPGWRPFPCPLLRGSLWAGSVPSWLRADSADLNLSGVFLLVTKWLEFRPCCAFLPKPEPGLRLGPRGGHPRLAAGTLGAGTEDHQRLALAPWLRLRRVINGARRARGIFADPGCPIHRPARRY